MSTSETVGTPSPRARSNASSVASTHFKSESTAPAPAILSNGNHEGSSDMAWSRSPTISRSPLASTMTAEVDVRPAWSVLTYRVSTPSASRKARTFAPASSSPMRAHNSATPPSASDRGSGVGRRAAAALDHLERTHLRRLRWKCVDPVNAIEHRMPDDDDRLHRTRSSFSSAACAIFASSASSSAKRLSSVAASLRALACIFSMSE